MTVQSSVASVGSTPKRGTSTVDNSGSEELQPGILSYVKDLPNLCSLMGLACTISAIYFSILGIYHAAMIGMVWAVAFDWADGLSRAEWRVEPGPTKLLVANLMY